MNISLAYEIREEDINNLEHLIQIFCLQFQDLYPNELVPKFHFLIHLVLYLRMFGPLRQQSCFRFERQYAYFKGLVPVVRNFKNTAMTMCYRHQARLCTRLNSFQGMPSKKKLYQGDKVTSGVTVLLKNTSHLPLFQMLLPVINTQTLEVMKTPKIIAHGTKYTPGSVILLKVCENELLLFGKVEKAFVYNSVKFLVLAEVKTI